MRRYGLLLHGRPWGRWRFWTRGGAQERADEMNRVRSVLGESGTVTVYDRRARHAAC